jgi:hypothetical protein
MPGPTSADARRDGLDGDVARQGKEGHGDDTQGGALAAFVVGAVNCHATAVAEDTSITESSPNPTNAVGQAMVPAEIATIASTTL